MSGTDQTDDVMAMEEQPVCTDSTVFRSPAYMQTPEECAALSEALPLECQKDDGHYFMDHKRRGKALIFNFNKIIGLQERKGSEVDVDSSKQAFEHLQFEVFTYEDESKESFLQILKSVAHEEHHDSDCLVVVIMTHGDKNELWASNAKFSPGDIWEPFTADKCPSLAGKPKLFFIQACRGPNIEKGVKVMDASRPNYGNRVPYTIPNRCDILVAQATMEGSVSVRSTVHGAWFIQSLCNELRENGRSTSLLILLTSVIRKVALDYEHQYDEKTLLKQQPVLISTLTREVYFKPKS